MKVLFQCNTVYQILVALQIRLNFYKMDSCDVIISDRMNDSDKIVHLLKQTSLFDSVFLQNVRNKNVGKIKQVFFRCNVKSISKLGIVGFNPNTEYNVFLFSNPYFENLVLYKALYKAYGCTLSFFEDGISTYSKYYEIEYCKASRGIKALLLKRNVMKKAEELFTFFPDYFEWHKIKLIRIPPLCEIDKTIVNCLNFVFEYKDGILPRDCKTIFFEESYFGDGKNIGDESIINYCIDYFGREGFYLKNHPRNKVNRFNNTSVNTFESMSIPWELIVLNNLEKIESINLVSISSQTIFTPTLLFGLKPRCYFCIRAIKDKTVLYPYIPEVLMKIAKQNDNFIWMNEKGSFDCEKPH